MWRREGFGGTIPGRMRLFPCLIIPALLVPKAAAEGRSSTDSLWAHTARAVGQIVDGDLPGAVTSVRKARAIKAAPELDALVGLAALQGGQAAAGARQLAAAVEHGSTHPLVFYWAARASFAAGQRAVALRRMEQAVAVGGDRPTLRMGHALLLAASGSEARAAAALRAVALHEPNLLDPSLYPTPAEGAVDLLEPLLRNFPERPQLLRTQGHLLWRAGCVTAALRRFRSLLSLAPNDADALQMQGRCLAALGQRAAALASVERALRAAPASPQALATRGELLLDGGESLKAMPDLQRAADAFPRDGQLLLRLAGACAESEKRDCARRFYTYALLRQPTLAAAHFGLALLDQQSSDKATRAAVRARFARAIELEPGSARYYEGAAHFATLTGDVAWARALLAEARAVRGAERRHRQRIDAGARVTRALVGVLDALARDPACDMACRAALQRRPDLPRRFVRAHLAARVGHAQPDELRAILARLKPSALWDRNPQVVETPGKTTSGNTYLLRSVVPLLLMDRFR